MTRWKCRLDIALLCRRGTHFTSPSFFHFRIFHQLNQTLAAIQQLPLILSNVATHQHKAIPTITAAAEQPNAIPVSLAPSSEVLNSLLDPLLDPLLE